MTLRTNAAVVFLTALLACSGSQQVASIYLASGMISAAQGGTLSVASSVSQTYSGTAVNLPPGALTEDTKITIAIGEALPGGDTAAGPVAEFGPSPTTFAAPVTVTLPFKLNGQPQSALQVVAVESDGTSTTLDNAALAINSAAGLLSFTANGFTRFGAIIAPAGSTATTSGSAGTTSGSTTGSIVGTGGASSTTGSIVGTGGSGSTTGSVVGSSGSGSTTGTAGGPPFQGNVWLVEEPDLGGTLTADGGFTEMVGGTFQAGNPAISTGCTGQQLGSCCYEPEQPVTPATVNASAGTIWVTASYGVLATLTYDADAGAGTVDYPTQYSGVDPFGPYVTPWGVGDTLTINNSGDEDGFAPFSVDLVAPLEFANVMPALVQMGAGTSPTLDRTVDYVQTWSPGTAGNTVSLDLDWQSGSSYATISCTADDGTGTATIPAALLANIPVGQANLTLSRVVSAPATDLTATVTVSISAIDFGAVFVE